MGNKDKKAEEVDSRTKTEIQDGLDKSNAFKGTDDDNGTSHKKNTRKKRSDRAGVSANDDISGTDRKSVV